MKLLISYESLINTVLLFATCWFRYEVIGWNQQKGCRLRPLLHNKLCRGRLAIRSGTEPRRTRVESEGLSKSPVCKSATAGDWTLVLNLLWARLNFIVLSTCRCLYSFSQSAWGWRSKGDRATWVNNAPLALGGGGGCSGAVLSAWLCGRQCTEGVRGARTCRSLDRPPLIDL